MAWAFPMTALTQLSGGSPQVTPSSSRRIGECCSPKGRRPPACSFPLSLPRGAHCQWGTGAGPGRSLGPQPAASDHRYWRFNEETQHGDPGYPKPISVWQGIPASPKGAFLSNDAGNLRAHHNPYYPHRQQGLPKVPQNCDGLYGGPQLCQALGWAGGFLTT